jgi:hypothetical protein
MVENKGVTDRTVGGGIRGCVGPGPKIRNPIKDTEIIKETRIPRFLCASVVKGCFLKGRI